MGVGMLTAIKGVLKSRYALNKKKWFSGCQLCCTLQLPGDLLQILMPGSHFQTF